MAGEHSDLELIEKSRDGDLSAFETLYRRHRDWVVSLAYRFCGNRDDALDVLQETFAYVLRKLPGLRLTAKFTTFLYPVVKHTALSRKKAARRHPPLPDEDPKIHAELPSDIEALLTGLSPLLREVVWMRFVDGFSLAEIAGALKVPLGTVKSRLHNALAALRKKK